MSSENAATLRKETEPVMFRDWEAQLAALKLPEGPAEAMRRSIVGLLGPIGRDTAGA